MKKLLAVVILVMVAATTLFAQDPEMRKSPHETVSGKYIKVTYGRPYKKGRDIFGGLEPYGKVWRTGADEATELTLEKDATFAGKKVKAGTYTLFTIPSKTEWTIILNSKTGQWGAFEYNQWKDRDLVQEHVPVKKLDKAVEQFTITPKPDGLLMEWDKTSVFVPVKF
jgi:hypothetical protein